MKRFTEKLSTKRNATAGQTNGARSGILDRFRRDSSDGSNGIASAGGDSPEANIGRAIRLFCESAGPSSAGEEVLHLPVIVEAAESSPAAAKLAAKEIRRHLSNNNHHRTHVQYNAVMLIRILAHNPGPTFTRNIDSKFVSTVQDLLRNGRDPSVQQILRETLQSLYTEMGYDTNLQKLSLMWAKEQGIPLRPAQSAAWTELQNQQRTAAGPQNWSSPPGTLPPIVELAARIEEARTSAKLLQQLVQSTAPQELQTNDLIKEFAERCQSAQRSMQTYINCDNPAPDDDTMQTLIETSEQLSLAASKHSRALLQARRANAQVTSPPPAVRDYALNGAGTITPVASATFVPSGRAPAPPTASQPTTTPYMPPPVSPPVVPTEEERGSSAENAGPYTPPRRPPPSWKKAPPAPNVPATSTPFSGPVELPAGDYDDPFADQHGNGELDEDDQDDLYNTSPTVEIKSPPFSPSSAYEPSAAGYGPGYSSSSQAAPSRPAPQPQESSTQPVRGSESSYAPGYESTPSYIRRQVSSGENLTMHGAAPDVSDASEPVSPDRSLRNAAANAPKGSGGWDHGNVSPVDTRSDTRSALS